MEAPGRRSEQDGRLSAAELEARLYDHRSIGWRGEISYYLDAARRAAPAGSARVLEVACGTGRVLFELARAGFEVAGVDCSREALEVARAKLRPELGVTLIDADMRSFEAPGPFDLAIVPGHAFQAMLTAEDQVLALRHVHRHLRSGGTVVLHINHDSLDGLLEMDGVERPGATVVLPDDGRRYRPRVSWTYDRGWQNATARVVWDQIDDSGQVVEEWEPHEIVLHVPSPVEIEHALRRAGFDDLRLVGSFDGSAFTAESEDMIWTGCRP